MARPQRAIFENAQSYVPYSVKFSRHLYFVDWPLKAISLHNVRRLNFRVEF